MLANSSGKSFDEIVALRKGGQGWGNIARDNGLNLGKVVSDARQSSKATMHAQESDFVSISRAIVSHELNDNLDVPRHGLMRRARVLRMLLAT